MAKIYKVEGYDDCNNIDMFGDVCHAYRAYYQGVKDFIDFLNNNAFQLRHDMELIDEYAEKFINRNKYKETKKQIWKKMLGVMTPGGDPAYECPVCGKGGHVYGVESLEPHRRCRDCGTELIYPFEVK